MKVTSCWIIGFVASLSAHRLATGIYFGMSGPTLLYLAENVGASVEQVSPMFTGRAGGYFLGTAIFGLTMNRFKSFDPFKIIGLNLIVCGALIVTIPWLTHLAALIVVSMMSGFILGFCDAGSQSLYLRLWGNDSRPYIQLYHFCAGFGSMISPLIATPFVEMAGRVNSASVRCPSNGHDAVMTTVDYNVTDATTSLPSTEINPVSWTYILSGSYTFLVGVIISVLSVLHVEHHVRTNRKQAIETRKEEPLKDVVGLFIPVLMFYFSTSSSLHVYYNYIYSAIVCSDLPFSVSDALLLNTLFGTGVAVSRLIGIVLAKFFQPSTIIAVNLIGSTICIACLSVFGSYIPLLVWIVDVFMGFFIGSLYPLGVSWTARVTNVSSTYILIFGLGNTLGQMSMLPLAGVLFDMHPFNVIYLIGGLVAALNVSFALMTWLGRRHRKREQESGKASEDETKVHEENVFSIRL